MYFLRDFAKSAPEGGRVCKESGHHTIVDDSTRTSLVALLCSNLQGIVFRRLIVEMEMDICIFTMGYHVQKSSKYSSL